MKKKRLGVVLWTMTIITLLFACEFPERTSNIIPQENSYTSDGLPPIPGGQGLIRSYLKTSTSISIVWEPAADDSTPSGDLEYKIIASEQDLLSSIESMESPNLHICQNWITGLSYFTIDNLSSNKNYFINISVKDSEGNIALYKAIHESPSLLGDVNKDGYISAYDAYIIAAYDANNKNYTLPDPAVANANGDFSINIVDALVIAQYLNNQITTLGHNPIASGTPLNSDTGRFTLVPQKTNITKGEDIIVEVHLDTGFQRPAAIKWILEYNPVLLSIGTRDVIPGDIQWQYYSEVHSPGRIVLTSYFENGLKPQTDHFVLSLKFKAKTPGEAAISLKNLRLIDEKLKTIGNTQDQCFHCYFRIN